ncbi:MAG TPA: ABC transporter permease [Longimicrobiales bacterium]|nr:ABC transporter permease [Longimicrobiales bacterium]
MNDLLKDIRHALRTLRRSPASAAVIVLTLALGIGANTAIFSVINGVLLRPLPYEEGEQLVRLRPEIPARDLLDLGVSAQELADYQSQSRAFSDVVEYHNMWFNLLGAGEPERVSTGVVSWNYFDVLGVEPVVGRTFTPDEDHLGAEPVLVLSHRYWQRRFAGDPAVVGSTVEMNDRVHTIVGVLPPLPIYPAEDDVYMPWYACPFRSGEGARTNRGMRMVTALARLTPGTTIQAAEADADRVASAMAADHPEAYPTDAAFGASVTPLETELTERARPTFLILLGMAGLVLLIACANVANLTLARMARRDQELAVRTALGAGRGRLVRQLLTESTVLALIGGLLGLLLAGAVLDSLTTLAAQFTPHTADIALDRWVLGFTLLVALGAGIAMGAAPALLMSASPGGTLRQGTGRMTASGGPQRLRNALVVSQLALAVILLVGAGLMTRSLVRLQNVDPGFDPERVLTMRLDLDFTTRTNAMERLAFYQPLLERLAELPGVRSAALTNNAPLNGGLPNGPIQIEGRPPAEAADQPTADFRAASPGYFDALRIPLVRGRTFTSADHAQAPLAAAINRTLADRLFAGEDPLGQRIGFVGGQNRYTIVGVVGDVLQRELQEDARFEVYVPFEQSVPLGATLLVRTAGDPLALADGVRQAVHAVDPRQPVAFVRTMADIRAESVASPRLTTLLLSLFAGLALAISVAGILGVVSYTVTQRTHEMGIRLALGARSGSVIGMVVGDSMRLAALGLGIGLAAALVLGRLIAGWLYDTAPADPLTFVGVTAVLLVASFLAAWVPARRIGRIDPAQAFRAS